MEGSTEGLAPERGCVFFNTGVAYVQRLLVAVWSLRQVDDIPITVFLGDGEDNDELAGQLRDLGCDVALLAGLSKSWSRDRLFQASPYTTTLVLDSDLLFRQPLGPLWEPLEREGVLVTRLGMNPHGVGGSESRPGWSDRVALLEQVRPLVGEETWSEATRRLVEDRIDVNIGVLGISRPRGATFLDRWAHLMERGRSCSISLMDEMLVLALLVEHDHALVDETWNCPADGYFRHGPLEDARVIHYFADGVEVLGTRLGRSPRSPAGRRWLAARADCAREVQLRQWRWRDPLDPGGLVGRTRRPAARAVRAARHRAYRAKRQAARTGVVVTHRAADAAVTVSDRLGRRVGLGRPERATAIVLSYRRPGNIEAIVRRALLCEFVDRVVVSNNNPEVDLADHVTLEDDRVVVLQQRERRGPSFRYELARRFDSDHYLCIDDDVFPTPWQLRALLRTVLDHPEVPAGSAGQVYVHGRRGFEGAPPGVEAVDVITRAYAFTRRHLDRYFELVGELGLVNDEVHSSEDVILSFAGDGRPRLAPVGHVRECPSSTEPGVATFKRPGFSDFRLELFDGLRGLSP